MPCIKYKIVIYISVTYAEGPMVSLAQSLIIYHLVDFPT